MDFMAAISARTGLLLVAITVMVRMSGDDDCAMISRFGCISALFCRGGGEWVKGKERSLSFLHFVRVEKKADDPRYHPSASAPGAAIFSPGSGKIRNKILTAFDREITTKFVKTNHLFSAVESNNYQ